MPPPPMSWARHSSAPITFLDPYFVVAFYKWGGVCHIGVGWGGCVIKGEVGWVGHEGVGWGGVGWGVSCRDGVGWVGHEGVGGVGS